MHNQAPLELSGNHFILPDTISSDPKNNKKYSNVWDISFFFFVEYGEPDPYFIQIISEFENGSVLSRSQIRPISLGYHGDFAKPPVFPTYERF